MRILYLCHYRELAVSDTWTASTTHTAYTVTYDKVLDDSTLHIYMSYSRSLRYLWNDDPQHHHTVYIMIDGGHCADPGLMKFTEYTSLMETTMTDGVALMGLCRGIPSGSLDISLQTQYRGGGDQAQLKISENYIPRIVIEEIYNDFLH